MRPGRRRSAKRAPPPRPAPGSGSRRPRYCKGTTTASGVNVRTGIAAADPDILPVGSVIQVDRLGEKYNGIYTIMDTGPKVQGRHIDIYMWSCHEALELGRRSMQIVVLRLGWNPKRQHADASSTACSASGRRLRHFRPPRRAPRLRLRTSSRSSAHGVPRPPSSLKPSANPVDSGRSGLRVRRLRQPASARASALDS